MTYINESQTAKGYTPAARVPAAFGRKRTIESITIHHWGVRGQTHDNVVKFFVSGPGTTSAHFVISDGRIDCIVNPEDAAWHSGNLIGNTTSIGLELRPEATQGDYETAAEVIRFLRERYGNLPLIPHRQWHATACPGVWDLDKLNRLAGSAAIAPQGDTTQEEPEVTPAQMQEIKDFVFKTVNTLFEQYHTATRATIKEHTDKVSYEDRVFNQSVVNQNTDRVINKLEGKK